MRRTTIQTTDTSTTADKPRGPGRPPSAPSRRAMLTGLGATVGAGIGIGLMAGAAPAGAEVLNGTLWVMSPTRLWDTRAGGCSGGRLLGRRTRQIGVGTDSPYALLLNITIADTRGSGYLALYDADLSVRPTPYSSINWQSDRQVVANFGIVSVGYGGFTVYCGSSAGSTHFILDVVGAIYPQATAKQAQQRQAQLLQDIAVLRGC